MIDGSSKHGSKKIVLLSSDLDFVSSVRTAFSSDVRTEFAVVEEWQSKNRVDAEITDATVVIADINDAGHMELSALQRLTGKASHRAPLVVVLKHFDENLIRHLLRMHVADIFIKPGSAVDLVQICGRVAQSAHSGEKTNTNVYTFVPVAGGVGTTTLAIQAAISLHHGSRRRSLTTCLVDLNFRDGASADYLEIDPRLDIFEIEPKPERLDAQLLEGMTSRHSSGLAVIAALPKPTEVRTINENVVMTLLSLVCQRFDQVVIDMPRSWQGWTNNVLRGSDEIFLVSEASVPGIKRAKQLLEATSAYLEPAQRPRVIVNRFRSHFFAAGLRRSDLVRALGDSFGGTVPYNRLLVKEAIDRGVPLEEVQKGNNVAAAIKNFCKPKQLKVLSPLAARIGSALGLATS